jgi:SAM-dependent methyltransferase
MDIRKSSRRIIQTLGIHKNYVGIRIKMRFYDRNNCRIIHTDSSPTPEFWDSHWQKNLLSQEVILGIKPTFVSRITEKYLKPKDGIILEGGCGQATHVASLSYRGYQCIGIDNANKTISAIKKVSPDLDVRYGNVRELPFEKNKFIGYWSLGVIEHFWEGYEKVGHEIARVLKPGGLLFLTFPYMSPIRKLKAHLNLYPIWKGGSKPIDFYQFVLDHRSVISNFEKWGFELLNLKPLDGIKGTKSEIHFLYGGLQQFYDYQGRSKIVRGMRFFLSSTLAQVAGHIVLLIFKRSSINS